MAIAKKTQPKKVKLHVRKGDQVIVHSGANKGKTGTVIRVFTDTGRILVDGDAAVYHTRHVKADPNRKIEGGRIQRLRPIHASNVALIDPSTGKACRVKHERDGEGRVVRVSKKSGHRFAAAGA
jgi:large subunit ribosomal protein L24